MTVRLKDVVKESWLTDSKDENPQLTPEQKKEFLSKVSQYNKYGKAIYNDDDLIEIANDLSEVAKFAEQMTMEETTDAFDKITIKRNMKDLKNLTGQFAKVASEYQSLKQRMEGLYEDMGVILNRYFDIKDNDIKNEELNEIDGENQITGKNPSQFDVKLANARAAATSKKTVNGMSPQAAHRFLDKYNELEKM